MTNRLCVPLPVLRPLAALSLVIAAGPAVAVEALLPQEVVPRRAVIDLSDRQFALGEVPLHLVTPQMARHIGPGAHLFIDIPNGGTFGCTANFIWRDGRGRRYLGAAGHCFLPSDRTATHGEQRDYDASGVRVRVCVEGCTNGGFSGSFITGKTVTLGPVTYARQTGQGGDLGNDFGIVEIPAGLARRVRSWMPMFGGPTGTAAAQPGDVVCHYGNGIAVGEVFPTMGRVGIAVGEHPGGYWMANTLAAPGDSGSAVEICRRNGSDVHGTTAVGILTHLALGAGLVVGTTTAQAIKMTRRDRSLSIVLVPAP